MAQHALTRCPCTVLTYASCRAAPATPGPICNKPLEGTNPYAKPGYSQHDPRQGPYTTLTCTLCQALLSTPRRFQMGAGDSGCVLYAPSTALHTSLSGPSVPCGSGTVAFHSVHAHALQV